MRPEHLEALRVVADVGNVLRYEDDDERRGISARRLGVAIGLSKRGAINRLLAMRRAGLVVDVCEQDGSRPRWYTTDDGERALEEVAS